MLTVNGIESLTGEQIKTQKFQKVIHYSSPRSSFKKHYEMVKEMLLPALKAHEAIVLDFGPNFRFSIDNIVVCGFCETFKQEQQAVECLDIRDVVSLFDFAKIDTPIDSLLPTLSYFAHMPKMVDAVVLEIQPFTFDFPNKKDKNLSFYLWQYGGCAAREFFVSEPELREILSNEGRETFQEQNYMIITNGKYVYNYDDPVLNLIISQSEKIFASHLLINLTKRYLAFLALNSIDVGLSGIGHTVVALEKILFNELNPAGKYVSYPHRRGGIAILHEQARIRREM